MSFTKQRTKLCEILKSAGIKEVNYSKATLPTNLPAGIVSIAERSGSTLTSAGYAEQNHKFEIHIVIEDTETADVNLLELVATIDELIQEELYYNIENVDFYDSLLNAEPIRIAHFEVTLT